MSERAALRWGYLLAALWATLALYVVHPEVVGLYHDDGIYVATAKSLAEGHGYRLIDLPGAPAQTKYPPLFPLALALIWRIAPDFPENVLWLKAFGILCSAAGLVLFQRVALRRLGLSPAGSVLALLLAIASPRLLASANWVLAEPLFGLTTALALLAAPRGDQGGAAGGRRSVISGALAGAAALARLQGLALICALPLALLIDRRRREAAWTLAAAALPLAGWKLWCAVQPAPRSFLLDYYTSYASTVSPWTYGSGWASLAQAVGTRLMSLPDSLGGLAVGQTAVVFVAGTVLLAGTLAGAAIAFHAGHRLVPLAAVSGVALTLLVPTPPTRFLIPWLPLLTGLAVLPIARLPLRVRWAGGVLGGVLFLAGAGRCALEVASVERASLPDSNSLASGRADWPGWVETAHWLEANAPESAPLASHWDSFYFLFSHRAGVRYAPFHPGERSRSPDSGEDPGRILVELRRLGIGSLVLDPGGVDLDAAGPAALVLGRAIEALPEARARLVFRSSDRGHEVWRLDAAPAP